MLEYLQFVLNYIVIPMFFWGYRLHIEVIKLKVRLEDYSEFKDSVIQISKDLHHIVEIHKKET